MPTQNLVEEGLRWRVGNGASIHVWEDRWLPIPSTYKVTSPRMFLQADTRVQELINEATAEWKSSVIDALFVLMKLISLRAYPSALDFQMISLFGRRLETVCSQCAMHITWQEHDQFQIVGARALITAP